MREPHNPVSALIARRNVKQTQLTHKSVGLLFGHSESSMNMPASLSATLAPCSARRLFVAPHSEPEPAETMYIARLWSDWADVQGGCEPRSPNGSVLEGVDNNHIREREIHLDFR
jgi:hypothetical protein